jgi:predicted transcriptional regulator
MTIDLTPAQEQRLGQIAADANRTPEELAAEALSRFLRYTEALAADVREGEESAEREGWLSNDEVFERLNRRLLKTA